MHSLKGSTTHCSAAPVVVQGQSSAAATSQLPQGAATFRADRCVQKRTLLSDRVCDTAPALPLVACLNWSTHVIDKSACACAVPCGLGHPCSLLAAGMLIDDLEDAMLAFASHAAYAGFGRTKVASKTRGHMRQQASNS